MTEQSPQEKKNKRGSAAVSVLIHVIVLLLFIIFGLSSSFPPETKGILINFGTMKTGKGDQPSKVIEQTEELSPAESEEIIPVQEVEETPAEIVTQDVEKAPVIEKTEIKEEPKKEPEKKTEVKKPREEPEKKPVKEKEVEKKPEKEEPKVDTKSLYTGEQYNENKPSNEGITYGPGDQGEPEGDPTSKSYEGGPYDGNAVGYELGGRNLLSIPPVKANYTETGKVVVSIKVDRNGQVIFAKYTVKGSTTTDPKLIQLAEEAALKAKFSSKGDAPEEQFGSITFNFKLK